MNEELDYQVRRSILQGEFSELIYHIQRILSDEPPLSSKAQLDEFLESAIYSDFLREMQAWIQDLEQLILYGGSEHSVDFLRGCLRGATVAMGFPDYLRKQIQDQEEGYDSGPNETE